MASSSGKDGTAVVNGAAANGLRGWRVEESGEVLDATDAEAAGTGQSDTGVNDIRVNLKGFHKLGSGPFPGLRRGSQISSVVLNLNKNVAGAAWSFTLLVVTEVRSMSEVRGQIEWDVDCENAVGGTYSGPTT
jgi:hypothetical protein